MRVPAWSALLMSPLVMPCAHLGAQSDTQSGAQRPSLHEEIPSIGPTSAGGQVISDEAARPVPSFLDSYRQWKKGVLNDIGLAYGVDYNAMYQGASASISEDDAASGAFRVYGTWTPVNRGEPDTGTLVFKVENRHRLGTPIPPQQLGTAIGYDGITATPFSDFGWGVTNLFWQQHLDDNRFALAAGVLDGTDYLDVYGLVSPWTAFSNLAFSTSPTIPVPNQGLGVYGRAVVADHFAVAASLNDANGEPTQVGFETFFEQREYFTAASAGWFGSWATRFDENVQLTAWHVDAREQAGTPEGWGLAISGSTVVESRWAPFLRAGYGDGGAGLWKTCVSTGLGRYFRDRADLLGLGLAWGRPTGAPDDDQYTAELFFRWQATHRLALTPDIQLLVNPAQNPDDDVIAVFGIRGRIAF